MGLVWILMLVVIIGVWILAGLVWVLAMAPWLIALALACAGHPWLALLVLLIGPSLIDRHHDADSLKEPCGSLPDLPCDPIEPP